MGEAITRREFTLKSALAMLAGTTITLAGCESDSPTAPTNTPSAPMVVTSIGSNHGHEAELSTADLTQTTITLDIQGSSSHPPQRRAQHGRPAIYQRRDASERLIDERRRALARRDV
jgi:hypothetical protein